VCVCVCLFVPVDISHWHDQAKLDVAKANRDKKKADMAKRQPSSKESKAYTAAIASKKVWRILN